MVGAWRRSQKDRKWRLLGANNTGVSLDKDLLGAY